MMTRSGVDVGGPEPKKSKGRLGSNVHATMLEPGAMHEFVWGEPTVWPQALKLRAQASQFAC